MLNTILFTLSSSIHLFQLTHPVIYSAIYGTFNPACCHFAMALHWLYLAVLSTWLASSLSNGSCPSLSGQRRHLYYSPKDLLDFTGTNGAHKLSCADGYVLDGPSDVECIKGVWRPWLPECRGDLQTCNHCSFELARTRCSSVLVVYSVYKILPFQDEVL